MKTIVLLGELGRKFGRKHMLDVKTPAEAIRALCANFKEFAPFVSSSEERNVGYRVINVRDDTGLDELHNPAGRMITIVPVIGGAGFLSNFLGSSLGKVVIGAALIAASIMVPGLAAVTLFGTTTLATVAFSIGASLALGGVAQLLAPTPPSIGTNAQDEQKPSYLFDGAVNTTSQGYPVPVGYGRMVVGSAVISAGISVEDIEA